jgi:putative peptide zinc metalloprotease protein
MAIAGPRLRTDLVISRQENAGRPALIVKDPSTGQFFRLKETESYILEQLDGSTSLEDVRRRVEQKFTDPLDADTLQQFITSLNRLGLLEKEHAGSGHLSHRGGTPRWRLFNIRVKIFDPDRLFEVLVRRMPIFFTPQFLFVSAALILVAVAITIDSWDEIARDFTRLHRLTTLPVALLSILVIGTCHEFAHGLTCKRFGGEVHDVGFLLIYFCPAFYCNVSDAWLFPDRSKRLWVTFAGPYFEGFLWALATLTWRLTAPDTGLNFGALVVMTMSGIRTLVNFTPLIKLDGYYLLTDCLEAPNLRALSFQYVGAWLRRMLGSSPEDAGRSVTPRERRIYLIYGLTAAAYTFGLLFFIGDRYGRVLIRNYGGWGIVLFGVLVAAKVQSRFRRLWPTPSTSAASGGIGDWFASVDRRVRNIAVLALVVPAVFLVRMELKVPGEFRALPIRNADARAEIEGIVAKIYVEEGTRVRQGDPIAELVDRDYRAELRKTEAELAEKAARLKLLEAGPRPEEIGAGRSRVTKSTEQLKYLQKLRDMNRALFERDLISLKEMEASEAQVAVQEQDLREAQFRLKVLEEGNRPEEIAAARAELSRLEAQRRYLQEQIGLLSVRSPTTGVVTTPWLRLRSLVGTHVNKGDLLVSVQELDTITTQIVVPEKEIGDVKVGQTVAVKARAYPEQTFYGEVTSIATTATSSLEGSAPPVPAPPEEGAGPKAVLVTSEVDNRARALKPEMTGKAKIYCGPRRLIDLMTRRLARYVRVEFWSWW